MNPKSDPQEVSLLTVTDLHLRISLYRELQEAVIRHQPRVVALVGDFLNYVELFEKGEMMEFAQSAGILAGLPCQDVVFTRGNHEDQNWLPFKKAWLESGRPLHALNGEVFTCGPLKMVGFPCLMGKEDAFIGDRPVISDDLSLWFPRLEAEHSPAVRTLWLMHEPPAGTAISERGSIVEGNWAWHRGIAKFSPLLTISGHDHLTPLRTGIWHDRIGSTQVVNVGQVRKAGLRYVLAKFRFESVDPSLPSEIQVTAFPKGQVLTIPRA